MQGRKIVFAKHNIIWFEIPNNTLLMEVFISYSFKEKQLKSIYKTLIQLTKTVATQWRFNITERKITTCLVFNFFVGQEIESKFDTNTKQNFCQR